VYQIAQTKLNVQLVPNSRNVLTLAAHHVDHFKPAQFVTNSVSQDALALKDRYSTTTVTAWRYHTVPVCLRVSSTKQENLVCKTVTFVSVTTESGPVLTTSVQSTLSAWPTKSSQAV